MNQTQLVTLWEGIHRPETDFVLDDLGFVYLSDVDGLPYWVVLWYDQPWQFFWHIDRFWCTHRYLTTHQALTIYATQTVLDETEAEALHTLNDKYRPR